MNLTNQKITELNKIIVFDSLNAALMSITISPEENIVAPDTNELIISVGDKYAWLGTENAKYKKYIYNLSKPLCCSDDEYGEFHQEVYVVNNEIKMRAYVEWNNQRETTVEELEPIDLVLFHGYNVIETNYQNVSVEIVYPKNDDLNRMFLNSSIYNRHKELNNSLSLEDLYFKDAFSKMGNELNEEVDNLSVKCITSKNNKFSLDSEGNLTVNSIITNDNLNINSKTICDLIYPVGSIYISVNDVNPTNLFGGEWEQIKDRFLLSSGDIYNNGILGGESSHKLTVSEMPSHSHNFHGVNDGASVSNRPGYYPIRIYQDKNSNWTLGHGIDNSGGNSSHNNMPPYITVNMWKRIA